MFTPSYDIRAIHRAFHCAIDMLKLGHARIPVHLHIINIRRTFSSDGGSARSKLIALKLANLPDNKKKQVKRSYKHIHALASVLNPEPLAPQTVILSTQRLTIHLIAKNLNGYI